MISHIIFFISAANLVETHEKDNNLMMEYWKNGMEEWRKK